MNANEPSDRLRSTLTDIILGPGDCHGENLSADNISVSSSPSLRRLRDLRDLGGFTFRHPCCGSSCRTPSSDVARPLQVLSVLCGFISFPDSDSQTIDFAASFLCL